MEKKVIPTYTKTAKRIARATWDASKTKKVRNRRTRIVEKSFKEFEGKMRQQALNMFMILKSGYGVRSPEFRNAMKNFKGLVNAIEHGCATANAWLEIANASK